MKSSFRWYGDSDPVTLDKIRQIPGMRSIVSAVYDVKPGEVWPEESIKHLVDECREHGLIFDVVESIPVTEEIKLGRPGRDRHIENYCESIRRCAKYGRISEKKIFIWFVIILCRYLTGQEHSLTKKQKMVPQVL